MNLNTLAARRIRAASTGPADELELLQMLGLVTPDLDWSDVATERVTLPRDPSKVTGMGPLSGGQPVITLTHEWFLDRPKVSTAPEGLRNLPPVVQRPVVQAVKHEPAPRKLAPCGTEAAAKRHVRYREPICDTCKAGRADRAVKREYVTTHGTTAGYQTHLRRKEQPCIDCRLANAAKRRERRAIKSAARGKPVRKPTTPSITDVRCGTEAGYSRHRRLGQTSCEVCRSAHSAHERERYRAKRDAEGRATADVSRIAACGTPSGYKRHRRNGEAACTPCGDANRAANRQRQAKKRAA